MVSSIDEIIPANIYNSSLLCIFLSLINVPNLIDLIFKEKPGHTYLTI